jgi:putative membrane protein insertion efficiency factor
MVKVALLLIRAYQLLLSPFIPHCCRFAPSCSCYAAEAMTRYGFWRGLGLSLRRLGRCHPFHPGGWDPVP